MQLAPHVHQRRVHPVPAQPRADLIDTKALGDRREIQCQSAGLAQATGLPLQAFPATPRAGRGEGGSVGNALCLCLRTEPPQRHQGAHGGIEGAAAALCDVQCALHHRVEQRWQRLPFTGGRTVEA